MILKIKKHMITKVKLGHQKSAYESHSVTLNEVEQEYSLIVFLRNMACTKCQGDKALFTSKA